MRAGTRLVERSEIRTYRHRPSMYCGIAWQMVRGWKVIGKDEVHPGKFTVHYQRFDGRDQA
jgi:hypothetical protein